MSPLSRLTAPRCFRRRERVDVACRMDRCEPGACRDARHDRRDHRPHSTGFRPSPLTRLPGASTSPLSFRNDGQPSGRPDGRANKGFAATPWAPAIGEWMRAAEAGPGMNDRALYEWLVAEHGYGGSYKAVQRYVRAHYAPPRVRVPPAVRNAAA